MQKKRFALIWLAERQLMKQASFKIGKSIEQDFEIANMRQEQ
jgi:hypothetical protein